MSMLQSQSRRFPDFSENDPLVQAMMKSAGISDPQLASEKLIELEAQADQASFLLTCETAIDKPGTRPTVIDDESRNDSPTQVGEYMLLQKIGQGGFGRVFVGYHQKMPQQKVAIKIFDDRWIDQLRRLEIEKLVLQKLTHPNLVKALDGGTTEDNTSFLVMNLIDGVRLDLFVQEHQCDFLQIAKLFSKIADAMEYAHEQDVVHRDLKPGNILVTPAGQPVITDFGLAKRLNLTDESSLTATGLLMGTLGYLAPEQADPKRREVTRKVDIYGLGATLYHVFAGQPPFERENVLKALDELKTRSPAPPTNFDPAIPADLERICLKCLAKSPTDRYASMDELANDLRRFVEGQPVAARPLKWHQRFQRWCRANPLVAALSLGLAVAVLAGLVTSVSFWRAAVAQQKITARLLIQSVEMSGFGDQAAESMLVQTEDSLKYRHDRLQKSVEFLDRLVEQFPDDVDLFRESATSWFRLGKVCCRQAQWKEGFLAYETALLRFRELAAADPDDPTLRFDVFQSLLSLDHVDRAYFKLPLDQEGTLTEALEVIQQLVNEHPASIDYRDA